MKIGFDAKRLFHNNTGLGNYSRTLVSNLLHYHPEIDVVLFAANASKSRFFEKFDKIENCQIVEPQLNIPGWRSLFLPELVNKHKINVFHGLSNALPFRQFSEAKSVVTIHDVIFKDYPKHYKWIDRKVYDVKTRAALQNSDSILAISEATREALLQHYSFDRHKLTVIPQSCSYAINLGAKQPSTLLFVSSITPRKNLLTILKAIRLLDNSNVQLRVAGAGGAYEALCKKYVTEHQLEAQVIFLGSLSQQALEQEYRNAHTMIYPSLMEGFGIPIIEALSNGCHVITSGISSMPEAGGSLAHYTTDPSDPKELSVVIKQVLDKGPLEEASIQKHLEQFSGERLTSQLVNHYKSLL